ncbi:uncharacterized protein PAF06_018605 [Gastrophryne carolinensis]
MTPDPTTQFNKRVRKRVKKGKGQGKFQSNASAGKGKSLNKMNKPFQGTRKKRGDLKTAAKFQIKAKKGQVTSAGVFRQQWMSKKKLQALQPKKVDVCAVCCVETGGTEQQKAHAESELHKELLEVKQHWLWEGRFHKTLDEQIEKNGTDMPFVGLQYIQQYEPNVADQKEEHTYECKLCHGIFRPRAIFYHVLSIQHRILYLAKHHKSMGIDKKYQITNREKYQNLVTCTANAAQIDGRKLINIIDHPYVAKEDKPAAATTVGGKKKMLNKQEELSNKHGGPTGIGMDVINQALATVLPERNLGGPMAQQSISGGSKSFHPAPGHNSASKPDPMLELLSAFLEARSEVNKEDSAMGQAAYDDGHRMPWKDPSMPHTSFVGGDDVITIPIAYAQPLPRPNTMPHANVSPRPDVPAAKSEEVKSFQELKTEYEARMKQGIR